VTAGVLGAAEVFRSLGADYLQTQRRGRALAAALAEAMRDCDLLLTAAHTAEAPSIGAVTKWASFEAPNFTTPFNLTGQSMMVVPAGVGVGGCRSASSLPGGPLRTRPCSAPPMLSRV
jgi:Asp-tRNA(Asn)/Glu-tRNA(Gln) amidotransferase A subunit family amidase